MQEKRQKNAAIFIEKPYYDAVSVRFLERLSL